MKKFDAFQIKLLMAILMVLDHLPHIYGLIPSPWDNIFHIITRCVGVWFAYMAVEGFLHTRNRLMYNFRLLLWAGIMFAGNTLLEFLFKSKQIIIPNNIFLTLALGVLMLNVIGYKSEQIHSKTTGIKAAMYGAKTLLVIAVMALGFLYSEGGFLILPFMLITYLLRNKPKLRNTAYVAFSLSLLGITLSGIVDYSNTSMVLDTIMHNCEWFFISVLPFIYLYNGKRGINNKFSKYFFYVFYPLHLWIIAAVSYMIK